MKLLLCLIAAAIFTAILLIMCGFAPASWAPVLMPLMSGQNAKLVWIVIEIVQAAAALILFGEFVTERLEAKIKAGFEPNANVAPATGQSLFSPWLKPKTPDKPHGTFWTPWFENPAPYYPTIQPATVTTTKTTYAPAPTATSLNTGLPPQGSPSPILSPPPPLPAPAPDTTPGPIVRTYDGLDEQRDILREIFAKHPPLRQEVYNEVIGEYLENCNRGDMFS